MARRAAAHYSLVLLMGQSILLYVACMQPRCYRTWLSSDIVCNLCFLHYKLGRIRLIKLFLTCKRSLFFLGVSAPAVETSNKNKRHGSNSPHETRRGIVSFKPAKLNIHEFAGEDTQHWIQIIEQYFDTAITPLEQRTEFDASYLKGTVVQWWRGTTFNSQTHPWHRFCRYLGDRFAESSICDSVKNFHVIQIEIVSEYIEKFERALKLTRRDNHSLPDHYYKNCHILY